MCERLSHSSIQSVDAWTSYHKETHTCLKELVNPTILVATRICVPDVISC